MGEKQVDKKSNKKNLAPSAPPDLLGELRPPPHPPPGWGLRGKRVNHLGKTHQSPPSPESEVGWGRP